MSRKLVLGLGLAAGVALAAVGCTSSSSSAPEGPLPTQSDEYKKYMESQKEKQDAARKRAEETKK
jgi:hypothetical protein